MTRGINNIIIFLTSDSKNEREVCGCIDSIYEWSGCWQLLTITEFDKTIFLWDNSNVEGIYLKDCEDLRTHLEQTNNTDLVFILKTFDEKEGCSIKEEVIKKNLEVIKDKFPGNEPNINKIYFYHSGMQKYIREIRERKNAIKYTLNDKSMERVLNNFKKKKFKEFITECTKFDIQRKILELIPIGIDCEGIRNLIEVYESFEDAEQYFNRVFKTDEFYEFSKDMENYDLERIKESIKDERELYKIRLILTQEDIEPDIKENFNKLEDTFENIKRILGELREKKWNEISNKTIFRQFIENIEKVYIMITFMNKFKND